MAFKRSNFGSLKSTKRETFELKYKFSKQVKDFKEGHDVYVIPLGLESGFYETPCHRVMPHKIDGQTIGFGGSSFPVYIKCTGIDEEGNKTPSLCCALAEKEKARVEDATKRIITPSSNRIHLPIMILGNSLNDPSKLSYPISKVAILSELKKETGLRFSYLDMASYTFKKDIVKAYGTKLKEEGVLDYELDEESDEFYEEVCHRLAKTIIKIRGVANQLGGSSAMKEYSFFPFDNPSIASGSGEDEKKAILNYHRHKEIAPKVDEFMQLFNIEVDGLVRSWKEKDLQEYYNSAIGVALKPSKDTASSSESEEKVEVLPDEKVEEKEPISDEEMDALLEDPFSGEDPINETENNADEALDDFSYDTEEEDPFFEEG